MNAEKYDPGEWAVRGVIAGSAEGLAPPSDLERECPELSAAEFRRFLKAANETDPTTGAHRRARVTRALLALVLVLAGLVVFLAGGRKEERAARAVELARLQREVCRSGLPLAHRAPPELERLCPGRP